MGQVSVPQAIADMAYNGENCHINHCLIYNTVIQIYKNKANCKDNRFKSQNQRRVMLYYHASNLCSSSFENVSHPSHLRTIQYLLQENIGQKNKNNVMVIIFIQHRQIPCMWCHPELEGLQEQ